jgi:hypothetical protein
MPRDIICDYCYKHIGNEKLAHFSDAAKDLDFCSEECYSIWKKWENMHQGFTLELIKEWGAEGLIIGNA